MTRPGDRLPPAVALDPVPNLAKRPVRPVLAIAPANAGSFNDATCELFGFDLVRDVPDDAGDWPATQLTFGLSNAAGAWSLHWPNGDPTIYGVGARVVLYALSADAATTIWLFSGWVTRWDQLPDDSIDVECFDVFATLARPAGAYTVGAPGDRPGTRAAALFAATGTTNAVPDATLDPGQVGLTVQQSDRSPLAELQTITGSDGGIAIVEPDGRLTTVGRGWRNGRTLDAAVPTISADVCDADAVIWNPLLAVNDGVVADAVIVSNVAGLTSRAGAANAVYPWSETDLQWTQQWEGDVLAGDIYNQIAPPGRGALASFDVYPYDPNQPDMWRLALDWRLLDRIHVEATQRVVGGGEATIGSDVIVIGTRDAFTIDGGWTRTVYCAPTGANLYTDLVWDATPTPAVWDAPTPNLWRY